MCVVVEDANGLRANRVWNSVSLVDDCTYVVVKKNSVQEILNPLPYDFLFNFKEQALLTGTVELI